MADELADKLDSGMENIDLAGSCKGSIVVFGEARIEFVPTVGGLSLEEAPAFKKAPGGAPVNVAVGVSKLGGSAAFIGKVGDDEFGHRLANVLKSNHVNVAGLRFDPQAPTSLAYFSGEQGILPFGNLSADTLMVAAELNRDLIRGSSVLHYGSTSLISEPSRTTHMAAMQIAQENGLLLFYTPNLQLLLWPSPEAAREGLLSIWKEADIIKISDEEVKFLTHGGDDKLDEVVMALCTRDSVHTWHPKLKLLLVTDGPGGCRYFTPHFKGRVNSYPVDTIDTTGAGDAFDAGFLHRLAVHRNLLSNEPALRSALQFACACAAITTTARGTIPAMPDMKSVSKFTNTDYAQFDLDSGLLC